MRPWSYLRAAFFLIAIDGGMSCGFDTGPHADATRESLAEAGMNETAIRIAVVENWLVDYYSNQPIAGLEKDLAKLHFDNLPTPEAVRNYWGRLASNTKKAVESAATNNQPVQLLALIGMSLHAVQDFYAHSNWLETHPAVGDVYNTETWFDAPLVVRVYTGRYPASAPFTAQDHGGYDAGLNHDSYSRPRWENAYAFSYAASRQWVNQVRIWATAVNGDAWRAAQQVSLSVQDEKRLAYDLEASYRISEWIHLKGADGHWKGKGSGSELEFGPFAVKWTSAKDSPFVKHFNVKKWHQLLCGGMGGADDLGVNAPPTAGQPAVARLPVNKRAIVIRTTYVEEDQVGAFERRIDSPGGKADFYAKITVNGQEFIESMQRDRTKITPAWTTIRFVDKGVETAKVRYELWDEDGGIAGDDDLCDINPRRGHRLDVEYNLDTHAISGDINGVFDGPNRTWFGKGDEKDRAKIRLYITTRDVQ